MPVIAGAVPGSRAPAWFPRWRANTCDPLLPLGVLASSWVESGGAGTTEDALLWDDGVGNEDLTCCGTTPTLAWRLAA